jgi:hypothetical protein
MMLPFILVEVLILLVFTLIDPSKSKGEIVEQDGVTSYRTICAHDSLTFYGIQLAYECCLVLAGCYLSFKTRKMKDDKFGESKQLILSMYNIALVAGVIFICISML